MAINSFSDLGYTIPFILTILIILTKFSLGLFLAKKVQQRKLVNQGKIQIDFIFGMCMMLFCIGISRVLYFIFDFFLTRFDPSLFYIAPNIYVWRAATLLASIGMAFLIFILEKKVFQFKTKGMFAIALLIISFVQLIYPIHPETGEQDFNTVSAMGIVGTVLGLIIPVTFIYLALKSSGDVRKLSIIIAITVIIYGLGAQLMSEPLLAAVETSAGLNARFAIIIAVPIIRIISLILLTYCITRLHYD